MISLTNCMTNKLSEIDYCKIYKPYKISSESKLIREDKINYLTNEMTWQKLCN